MSDNDLGTTKFKNKLDMGQIIFRLVDRVNLTASRTFEAGVLQKINNLPMAWRDWVEEQSERYSFQISVLEHLAPCGFPIGSEENPCMHDQSKSVLRLPGEVNWDDENIAGAINIGDEEDPIYEPALYNEITPVKRFIGEINWDDPNILSPKMVNEEHLDYVKLDAIIMEAHEFAGLTYQTDLKLIDGGDTIEHIKKRRKTPFRKLRLKEDQESAKEG